MSLKSERLINSLSIPSLETIRQEILLSDLLDLVREKMSTDSLAQIETDLALLSSEVDNWPRVSRLLEVVLQNSPQENNPQAEEW